MIWVLAVAVGVLWVLSLSALLAKTFESDRLVLVLLILGLLAMVAGNLF